MKSWYIYLFIGILSCVPLISIFLSSDLPHTSDGAMHAIRFVSYYKELTAGQFPVRWTSQFHYGYGTPLFNFVYPLPYIMAVPFIAAGMSPVLLLKLSFAFTYILAGIFMYLFAITFFKDRKTAVFVSIMYQFAPFRLVEMIVRGNLGTLYSYMLLPLVLFSIINSIRKKSYMSWALLSVSICLLAISHTIIGFSFIGLSALFVLVVTRNIKEIIKTYLAFLTGMALGAFFIIPAVLEQKYTNGYLFTKDIFYHHFPSLKALILPNFTNAESLRVAEVSVQIGFFHVISLLAMIYLILRKKATRKDHIMIVFLLFISILTIFFMQPVAKTLWENFPIIRQFQHPWRFISILTFTTAFGAAFSLRYLSFLRNTSVFVILSAIVVLSTVYFWRPPQGFQNYNKSFYWDYPITTNYFSEVNSIWMAEEPSDYPDKRIEVFEGDAKITTTKMLPTKHEFKVAANSDAKIVDRTYFFPGWKVFIDGKPTDIQFQDPRYSGLITFQITEGNHLVSTEFNQSKIQQLGNLISVLTLLSISILGLFQKRFMKYFKKVE